MLKWISKSGTIVQFTIFTIILVLTWLPALINPVPAVLTSYDGLLFVQLVNWLKLFPILTIVVALAVIVLQSFVLFYVYQANGFFKRSNFLPAIIILIGYSWNSNFQTLHAIIPASLFIIIALNSIMGMYGRPAAYHQVFTAAFSIGIASLFYIPLAYLLVTIWFTLITYRISSWREYAVSIIGFILPLLYYVSLLFWNDELPTGLHHVTDALLNIILPARLSVVNTIWLSFSAFILIVTMVAVLNAMNDKLISLRRRSWVLFNFSLMALVMMLLTGWPILSANYLFVIPMSFFITGSVTMIKRKFWLEMLALGFFLFFVGMRIYMVVC